MIIAGRVVEVGRRATVIDGRVVDILGKKEAPLRHLMTGTPSDASSVT
jgi:hypothetical protein